MDDVTLSLALECLHLLSAVFLFIAISVELLKGHLAALFNNSTISTNCTLEESITLILMVQSYCLGDGWEQSEVATTFRVHIHTQINQTLFFRFHSSFPFYFMFKLFLEVILGAFVFPQKDLVIALNYFFLYHIYQTHDLIVHNDNC